MTPETTTPRFGKLIVVEGIDGSGKTTLIKKIAKELTNDGYRVTISAWRESKTIGNAIRDLAGSGTRLTPRAFSALHAADFADRVYRDILPALADGHIVICDRYFHTELVRDSGLGIDPTWSHALFPFAPTPDIILHIDVSLATSLARIRRRVKESGRAAELNTSLRTAVLGSLLGSLDSTTGLLTNARYKESGEPLTETDREQIKFGFQVKTRDVYRAEFAHDDRVVTINGEQKKKSVFADAMSAILGRIVRVESVTTAIPAAA